MDWIGTSGYNYPAWKGSFYPSDLPAKRMLAYYAEHLRTVEINYTFYRMPTEGLLAGWVDGTPEGFRFTLKAPRRITHLSRLKHCEDVVRSFCEVAQTLGPRLGALLFQLPPNLKMDLALLDAFCETLPPRAPAAFEFRHASWHDTGVFECLTRHGFALCIADSETLTTPVVATAPFGYLRLRDQGYGPDDIERWAEVVEGFRDRWRETFVYFKHEDEGTGPAFAARLLARLGPGPTGDRQ
jgi:uncharacterized protein YecE (DUF72 family)